MQILCCACVCEHVVQSATSRSNILFKFEFCIHEIVVLHYLCIHCIELHAKKTESKIFQIIKRPDLSIISFKWFWQAYIYCFHLCQFIVLIFFPVLDFEIKHFAVHAILLPVVGYFFGCPLSVLINFLCLML